MTRRFGVSAAALIFTAALAARILGLGYGLPFVYHQDEPILVNHALAIGATRDWNPHFFAYGPIGIYILFILYALLFVGMELVGMVAGPADFAIQYLKHPTVFYLVGRFFLGVLPGFLAVYIIAGMGRRLMGNAALYAAAFMALMPLHAQISHHITVDALLTLAATALFLLLVDILEKPAFAKWTAAGAVTGFGVSCKMTAVFFLPAVLLAALLAGRDRPLRIGRLAVELAVFGSAALVVYAVLSPFTFLDWTHFMIQMSSQKGSETILEPAFHLTHSLIWGVGAPALVLAAVGIIADIRHKRSIAWLILFWTLFLYTMNTMIGMPFARRILPMTPVLCLAAGRGWASVHNLLSRRRLSIVLFAAILILSAVPTFYTNALFLKTDTRTQCVNWFHERVPAGSTVVVDNRFFGPRLEQTKDLISSKRDVLKAAETGPAEDATYISGPEINRVRSQRLDLMLAASDPEAAYRIYALSGAAHGAEVPLFMLPVVAPELGELDRIGARYLVFNYSEYQPAFHELKEKMGGRLHLEAVFSPYRTSDKKYSTDRFESTGAPVQWEEIFSRKYPGPYLEVYRILPSRSPKDS